MAWNYGWNGYNPTYMPQMPVQAPHGVPQAQAVNNTPAAFNCRPVTSKEEAQAVQVDFFGLGTLMPDLGHGVVYLKRFNQNTGACDIFEFTAQQTKEPEPVRYATIEDLNALRDELMSSRKVGKSNDE
jgi:hypothetical protein